MASGLALARRAGLAFAALALAFAVAFASRARCAAVASGVELSAAAAVVVETDVVAATAARSSDPLHPAIADARTKDATKARIFFIWFLNCGGIDDDRKHTLGETGVEKG